MACRRHSLNKPKNIKIAYILPTNRVTDQSPAPLSNVKSIKKPWKHWTERRQKSCVDYWLCRNRKSTIRMPVHIEIIDRTEDYDHISLAHYGQQNGDAMRDPEMIFALHKESQQFVPYYYRNDYMGMEQYSVRWTEEGVLLNRRLQADHTTFANRWLRNIATQQHLLWQHNDWWRTAYWRIKPQSWMKCWTGICCQQNISIRSWVMSWNGGWLIHGWQNDWKERTK